MIGLKYISPADDSGYGVAAKAYLRGLVRRGAAVTWTPLVRGKLRGRYHQSLKKRVTENEMPASIRYAKVPYDTVIVHAVPEYIPHVLAYENGKRWFAYTVWETDVIPPHWPGLLNRCHAVLVPSRFSREAMKRGGVRCPIHVIPHIATRQGSPSADQLPGIDPKCFVFYTISEWIPRKACDLTVTAYLRAFNASDNCVLIVKTGKYDQSLPRWKRPVLSVRRQISRLVSQYERPAKIVLIDEHIPEEDIHALHRRGNCFVSLTRGEGWGLGAFEAAAAGNPAIIPGYGGQTEYLPENYPYFVRHTLVPIKSNRGWRSYSAGQRWAEPNIQDAVRLLRRAAAFPEKAGRVGETLKTAIHDRYGEEAIIGRMLDRLTRT
jgi:glycosyltransferase involved in cell wall biosynthesis